MILGNSKTAVISISTKRDRESDKEIDDPADIKEGFRGVLRMQFDSRKQW